MATTPKEREDHSTPQKVLEDTAVIGAAAVVVEGRDHYHMSTRPALGPGEWWGGRHTLTLLGFLGFSVVFAMRVCLSVAIVAMVKSDTISTAANNGSDVCPLPDDYTPENSGNVDGEFEWNETTQGQILGSTYIGYLLTSFLGGRAAEYLGGKMVYGLGILLTGISTLLSPVCARTSFGLFIALKIFAGATEGVTFPAMNVMLATWIPPRKRAKFSSLVYAGAQFGTVISLMTSGWLCESDFLGGWPSVFYVFGVLSVVWSLAWFFLVFDNPAAHTRISHHERDYILYHCGHRKGKPTSVPWWALVTSLPVWSLIVVHFGQNWGFLTLLTELPTYLKNIQHYDMMSSGFLSSLPYLVMWVFSVVFSAIMDRLLAANKISIIVVRKTAMVIGLYGPMVGLLAMCFVDCDSTLVMVVLCLAVGLNGAIYCGYMCSHQDLAPNFAGTLMGLTTTIATIPGVLAPYVAGAIINDNQTLSAWRTVFLISSVVYLVSNIGYLVFMTAQVQPWNSLTSTSTVSTISIITSTSTISITTRDQPGVLCEG